MNGAKNGVVAYGIDHEGNYFPIQTSSVPDFSGFRALTKLYSPNIIIDGSIAQVVNVPLPGIGEDERVFIHGFSIIGYLDSEGYTPLNDLGNSGLDGGSYFPELTFHLDDTTVGDITISAFDGYMGDLALLTGYSPVIMPSAVPGESVFRWVSGVLDVGALINVYQNAALVRISSDAGGSGFLKIRAIYSKASI